MLKLVGLKVIFTNIIASLFNSLLQAVRPHIISLLLSGSTVFFFNGLSDSLISFNEVSIFQIFILLEIFLFLISNFQSFALVITSTNIGKNIREKLTSNALSEMKNSEEYEFSQYAADLKINTDIIETFFREYFFSTITSIFVIISTIIYVYYVQFLILKFLLAEFLSLSILTFVFTKYYEKFSSNRNNAESNLIKYSTLSNRRALSIYYSFLGSLWFKKRISEINNLAEAKRKLFSLQSFYLNINLSFVSLFIGLGYLYLICMNQGSLSDFSSLVIYSGYLIAHVFRISSFVHEYREANSAFSKINKKIFRNRSLRIYDETAQVLKLNILPTRHQSNRQISISKGERISIEGTSGSGKTTFLKAIIGIKKIHGIKVFFEETSGKLVHTEDVKIKLCYLSDTPVFEYGNIEEYLGTSNNSIQYICDHYNLDLSKSKDDLKKFLLKEISQTGEPLSLGERQRLQFIKAISNNPKYLLLDEAFSGLPEEQERNIIQKLILNSEIDVIIYVGHRKSTASLFEKRLNVADIMQGNIE